MKRLKESIESSTYKRSVNVATTVNRIYCDDFGTNSMKFNNTRQLKHNLVQPKSLIKVLRTTNRVHIFPIKMATPEQKPDVLAQVFILTD